MFKLTLLLIVSYCLAFSVAQSLSKTEFEAAADKFISTHSIKAFTVVAFNKDSNQVYKFEKGHEIPEGFPGGPKALSANSSYGVASISKMYVWTAIMALLDDGKITSLDQDVNLSIKKGVNGVPSDFSMRHPEHPSVPITWKMFMQHAAGFVRDFDDFKVEPTTINSYGADYWTIDNLTSMMMSLFSGAAATQSGRFYEGLNGKVTANSRRGPWVSDAPTPGTFHLYSNVGSTVAGWLVEQASGVAFETYVKTRILDRIGVTNAGFAISENPNIVYPVFVSNGATRFAYDDDGNTSKNPYISQADYPAGTLKTSAVACTELFKRLILNDGQGLLSTAVNTKFLTENDQLTNSIQFLGWEFDEGFHGHSGSIQAAQARVFANKATNQGWFWAHNGEVNEDLENDFILTIEDALAALLSNVTPSTSLSATSSVSVGASKTPSATITPTISQSTTATRSRGAPDSPSATRSLAASATSSTSTGASTAPSTSTGASTAPSTSTGASPSTTVSASSSTGSDCHDNCRVANKACKVGARANTSFKNSEKRKAVKECKKTKQDCRKACP